MKQQWGQINKINKLEMLFQVSPVRLRWMKDAQTFPMQRGRSEPKRPLEGFSQ